MKNWWKLSQELSQEKRLEQKDGLKPNPKPTPYDAIDTIKSLGFQNPLNPRQTVIEGNGGYVKVEIRAYDNKTIWLNSIEAMNPKQGSGTAVLQKVIDIANQNNVAIYLDPMSFGTISNRKLISWYKSHGFVVGQEDFKHGISVEEAERH